MDHPAESSGPRAARRCLGLLLALGLGLCVSACGGGDEDRAGSVIGAAGLQRSLPATAVASAPDSAR